MLKQFVMGLGAFLAIGFAQAQPTAGVEYRELAAAQPTDTAGKIEVIEFFSYLCPHCYNLLGISDYLIERSRKASDNAAPKRR